MPWFRISAFLLYTLFILIACTSTKTFDDRSLDSSAKEQGRTDNYPAPSTSAQSGYADPSHQQAVASGVLLSEAVNAIIPKPHKQKRGRDEILGICLMETVSGASITTPCPQIEISVEQIGKDTKQALRVDEGRFSFSAEPSVRYHIRLTSPAYEWVDGGPTAGPFSLGDRIVLKIRKINKK